MNEFPKLEDLSKLLNELISKSENLLSTINKFSLRKRISKKEIESFCVIFNQIIELQYNIESITDVASVLKQRPLTSEEVSRRGLSNKMIRLIKKGIVSILALKNTYAHDYSRATLDRKDIESSVKGLDKLSDIYDSLPAKTSLAAYLEIFKSVASYYHEHKESHLEFTEYQVGFSIDDEEITHFCHRIRDIGGKHFNNKVAKKENFDKFMESPEFKIRKNFEGTISAIKEMFHSVHPEIGAMADMILHPKNLKKTKDADTLYMIHAYNCMPLLVVNTSTKFGDEVGITHELAHGIHFALRDRSNSVLNIEQTTTTIESVSLFFELLFIHRQVLKAKSPASAENLRNYMTNYLTSMFYQRAMLCEFESQFFAKIGSSVKNEADVSKLYADIWKKYWGNRFNPPKKFKEDWTGYYSLLTPHMNFVYLLSVIYAVDLFLKYISFEIKGDDILKMLKKGDEFSAHDIIPWENILSNDETYFERILKVILEFNRAK